MQQEAITYIKCFSTLMVVTSFSLQVFSQQRTIAGTVTDAGSSAGLPGVTVSVKGTNISTQTDADGRFSVNAGTGKTLVFSFVGYEGQEVEPTGVKLRQSLLTPTSCMRRLKQMQKRQQPCCRLSQYRRREG